MFNKNLGPVIKNMEKEFRFGKMVLYMKAFGKMIKLKIKLLKLSKK